MAFLSDPERDRVRAAVEEAERRTAGEFVTVLAESSGSYLGVRLALPALVALAVPWPLLLLGVLVEPASLLLAQAVAFALLAVPLSFDALAMRLVPDSVKRARAAKLARAQFHDLGLHGTGNRAGVLFFVSVAEHYVEILADRGIAERVDPDAWRGIVDRFVADVRQGRVADGFVRAVGACGTLLEREFPRPEGDRNELPDVFLEI